MGLNWSKFFSKAGEGLGEYANYASRRKQDKEERERHDKERAEDKKTATELLGYRKEQDRLDRVRQDRKDLREPAEKRASDLADLGIIAPPDFVQDASQAGLPDAQQAIPDAGSMVISALRGAGKAGVDRVYREGPDALNKAFRGKGLSESMPGGGMAVIEPSVRATLMNAEASRDQARAMRQTLTANQSRGEEEEETEGLALLNSILAQPGQKPSNPKLAEAFGPLYRAARIQNRGMSPGRLAKQVVDGLKQTRTDLFPQPPGATGQLGKILGMDEGAPAVSPAEESGRPTLDAADLDRAKTDAGFRAWLIDQGYQLPDVGFEAK